LLVKTSSALDKFIGQEKILKAHSRPDDHSPLIQKIIEKAAIEHGQTKILWIDRQIISMVLLTIEFNKT